MQATRKEVITVILLLLAAGFCENMCDSPIAFIGAWACAITLAVMWLKKAPACGNTDRS